METLIASKFKSRVGSLLVLVASAMSLMACSPAEFKMYNEDSKNAGLDTGPGSDLVCDPFDSTNIISSTSGLKGSIHYLTANQPRYTSSTDIIKNGTKVNADLFLNRVYVPSRKFEAGFVTEGGTAIKDSNGILLSEYFGLNLESSLKLGPGESAGDYQLAVLADDGATLSLMNSKGALEPIVKNEGAHSAQLACSSKVISMTSSTRLPMNLSYFQGPRYHIALIVMWRKIAAGSSSKALTDVECGKTGMGNEYFFTPGDSKSAAVVKTPYQQLLDRGWKPLSNDNFELQSGSNRCAL